MRGSYNLAYVLLAFLVSACGGSGESTTTAPASESVADRFADLTDDERETVMISPLESGQAKYQVMPAVFDTVVVRAVAGPADEPRLVDVLLKGSFPDACTELNELTQSGHEDDEIATLTMRRPESAVCAQVVRPYRFFFQLSKRYAPGEHTLLVNDVPFRFEVE
jgi:hypothetical protein